MCGRGAVPYKPASGDKPYMPAAQGEVEVSVLFAPEREGACAAAAWCQMEGRTARVRLTLQGQGQGPLVR